jgi:hypothetical protein
LDSEGLGVGVAEELSIAVGDAVTVLELAETGASKIDVADDEVVGAEGTEVMAVTVEDNDMVDETI